MHFGAEGGTYVYFRYDATRTIMVALNRGADAATLDSSRFAEMLKGARAGVDIITGTSHALEKTLTLPARSALILEI